MSKLALILCSFAVLAASFPRRALAQETASSTWKGTLNSSGQQRRLQVDIQRKGNDLTGVLTSVDDGNARINLAEVVLDATTLSFTIPAPANAVYRGRINAAGTVAEGEYRRGERVVPLNFTRSTGHDASSAEVPKEAWIGKLNGIYAVQFRIVDAGPGVNRVYFDSITERQMGFLGNWKREGNQLTFDIPGIQLNYAGELNQAGDAAEGIWRTAGREMQLRLNKSGVEVQNTKVWENRPQRPQPPFPYKAEEVRIPNAPDNLTLAGTLTLPEGAGPHPAVVLISGSGQQDRDEFIQQHRPFLVLADYLTRRGIAVLRYDDRGTAQSTGVYRGSTVVDLARDASAAVAFLKTHPRIDAKRIGLVGHSEGTMVAPLVSQLRNDIAFLVLMAAAAVNGETLLRSQGEAVVRASRLPEEDTRLGLAVDKALIDIAAAAGPGDDLMPRVIQAADRIIETMPEAQRQTDGEKIRAAMRGQVSKYQDPWMHFTLAYDPAPALASLKVPVLALWGSKDLQVLPALNRPAMEKALTGNPNATCILLDGLNHMFQAAETGVIAEYAEIDETLNPRALAAISDWLTRVSGSGNR